MRVCKFGFFLVIFVMLMLEIDVLISLRYDRLGKGLRFFGERVRMFVML